MVDRPDSRKIHSRPIPRIGGIPIAISIVLTYLISLAWLRGHGVLSHADVLKALRLLPAAGLIFSTGLVDDLFGLKPWQKIVGQLAAAGWAYAMGVRIAGVAGFTTHFWWSFPLTIFWLIFCTNAFNLIDGVDGLASGVGLVASLTTLIAAIGFGHMPLALATAPLVGALLGFLRYNFNPASIFLGDSGSLTLGFLLSSYGVIWSHKSSTFLGLLAPIMAVSVPILEVCLSVARRFLSGRPLFSPDRGHIHHRLLDQGLSPRAVSFILCGASGIAACFALLQNRLAQELSGLTVIIFFGLVLIGIQHLRYAEFELACELFLEGAMRNIISSNLALSACHRRLLQARSVDDCWLAVREVSNAFGFRSVKLQVGEAVHEEYFGTGHDSENCWTTFVRLGSAANVSLTRDCKPLSRERIRRAGKHVQRGGHRKVYKYAPPLGISSLMDLLGGPLAERLGELAVIQSQSRRPLDARPAFVSTVMNNSSFDSDEEALGARAAAGGE